MAKTHTLAGAPTSIMSGGLNSDSVLHETYKGYRIYRIGKGYQYYEIEGSEDTFRTANQARAAIDASLDRTKPHVVPAAQAPATESDRKAGE